MTITEPCTGPCGHCGGCGYDVIGYANGDPPEQEPCPVCEGSGIGNAHLPDLWRPALVWIAGALVRGGIAYDRDDQPRSLFDDEIANAPDVPEWWLAMIAPRPGAW